MLQGKEDRNKEDHNIALSKQMWCVGTLSCQGLAKHFIKNHDNLLFLKVLFFLLFYCISFSKMLVSFQTGAILLCFATMLAASTEPKKRRERRPNTLRDMGRQYTSYYLSSLFNEEAAEDTVHPLPNHIRRMTICGHCGVDISRFMDRKEHICIIVTEANNKKQ